MQDLLIVAEASLFALKLGQARVALINGSVWAESPWPEANKDVHDMCGPKWALTDCILQQGCWLTKSSSETGPAAIPVLAVCRLVESGCVSLERWVANS